MWGGCERFFSYSVSSETCCEVQSCSRFGQTWSRNVGRRNWAFWTSLVVSNCNSGCDSRSRRLPKLKECLWNQTTKVFGWSQRWFERSWVLRWEDSQECPVKSLHLHPLFDFNFWSSKFKPWIFCGGYFFSAFSKVHPYQKLKKEAPRSQWQTEMNYSLFILASFQVTFRSAQRFDIEVGWNTIPSRDGSSSNPTVPVLWVLATSVSNSEGF